MSKSRGKGNVAGKGTDPSLSIGSMKVTDGLPWALLPCELELESLLQEYMKAHSAQELEECAVQILRAHPFVNVKGSPEGKKPQDFGVDLGVCTESHFRLDIRRFNRWLKSEEGRPFCKAAGGPSDDGMYTLSPVLRRFMPRGLSHFTFASQPSDVIIVRGFRKFTGLTAEDEDEESGATNMYEDFYYSQDAQAARFSVTTKSNGENGKWSVRQVGNELIFLAGSKNTCIVWRAVDDVSKDHPPYEDGSIPGPSIAAAVQRLYRSWSREKQEQFAEAVSSGKWTLMLESNCSQHEHVFPIPADFIEFVAILDSEGLPLTQKAAFAFFDKFGIPRVRCEEGLPIADLSSRLSQERVAIDREGAVLYLETESGAPVGLLKVKTNFYVRARRTRQIFWSAIVDPIIRGDDVEDKTSKNRGWHVAEKRLRSGMKELKHVEGCAEDWEQWADMAVGFVMWWRENHSGCATTEDQKKLALDAKNRFGTTYRDYCRAIGHPGGNN